MHLVIDIKVKAPLEAVKAGFTRELFLALTPPPPFPKVNLLRFDGCKKGDQVVLELLLLPGVKQLWTSDIVADTETTDFWEFVDRGVQLPFFLVGWEHRHQVFQQVGHTLIREDITFATPWWLPAALMKPMLRLQFSARKPVYERIFGKG